MATDIFQRVVAETLDELPAPFCDLIENVVVLVESEHPDEPDLYGLYEGVPLTERGEFWAAGALPDRITIYRLPLQRLPRVHVDDPWHRQVAIEGAVFRAAAELLGRDPWEVAPDRWRHH